MVVEQVSTVGELRKKGVARRVFLAVELVVVALLLAFVDGFVVGMLEAMARGTLVLPFLIPRDWYLVLWGVLGGSVVAYWLTWRYLMFILESFWEGEEK